MINIHKKDHTRQSSADTKKKCDRNKKHARGWAPARSGAPKAQTAEVFKRDTFLDGNKTVFWIIRIQRVIRLCHLVAKLVIRYATPASRALNAAYLALSVELKSPPSPPFLLLVVGPGINLVLGPIV